MEVTVALFLLIMSSIIQTEACQNSQMLPEVNSEFQGYFFWYFQQACIRLGVPRLHEVHSQVSYLTSTTAVHAYAGYWYERLRLLVDRCCTLSMHVCRYESINLWIYVSNDLLTLSLLSHVLHMGADTIDQYCTVQLIYISLCGNWPTIGGAGKPWGQYWKGWWSDFVPEGFCTFWQAKFICTLYLQLLHLCNILTWCILTLALVNTLVELVGFAEHSQWSGKRWTVCIIDASFSFLLFDYIIWEIMEKALNLKLS